MAELEAVLFDFGHTLFYSPSAAAILVEKGADPELAERAWQEILEASASAAELAKGRDLDPDRHREMWTALFARTEVLVPGVAAELYERVMPPGGWTPYPDALPVLQGLRARDLRVGIISNITADLQPVFREHGLDRYVDAYTHSHQHRIEKPDPRLFLEACRAIGSRPSATLMVGDSPVADGGAARAGLPVLILPQSRDGEPRGLELVLKIVGPGLD